jgi:hypothetical protein
MPCGDPPIGMTYGREPYPYRVYPCADFSTLDIDQVCISRGLPEKLQGIIPIVKTPPGPNWQDDAIAAIEDLRSGKGICFRTLGVPEVESPASVRTVRRRFELAPAFRPHVFLAWLLAIAYVVAWLMLS